jgi:hypothetical protein
MILNGEEGKVILTHQIWMMCCVISAKELTKFWVVRAAAAAMRSLGVKAPKDKVAVVVL